MKDLTAAYARIARLEAQAEAIYDKREAEFRRIRKEGRRVAQIAIRKAKMVRGETLIQIGKWVVGIYEGTELNWPASGPEKEWSFIIHTRTVRKDGRPGKGLQRNGVFVAHPGLIFEHVKIVGKITTGKVGK